jgi:hypothetical protein
VEHILVKEGMTEKNGNKSSKEATTERGTYVSKIGNKSMHVILL